MQDRPTKLKEYQTYIDGKWCDAASGKKFQTFDPYTGEPWALIPECDAKDVGPRLRGGLARLRQGAVAGHDADRARQAAAPHRRPDREARRAPGRRSRCATTAS